MNSLPTFIEKRSTYTTDAQFRNLVTVWTPTRGCDASFLLVFFKFVFTVPKSKSSRREQNAFFRPATTTSQQTAVASSTRE